MCSFGFLIHASLNSALATYTLGANVENLVLLAAPSPGHSAAAPYLPLEAGEPVEIGDQLANIPNRRPHRAPFGDGGGGAPAVPIAAVALAGRSAAGAAMHPTGPAPRTAGPRHGRLSALCRARQRGAAFASVRARRQPGAWG